MSDMEPSPFSSLYSSSLKLLTVITILSTISVSPSICQSKLSFIACCTQFDHFSLCCYGLYCCLKQRPNFLLFERSTVPGNVTFNLTPYQFYWGCSDRVVASEQCALLSLLCHQQCICYTVFSLSSLFLVFSLSSLFLQVKISLFHYCVHNHNLQAS